MSSIFDPIADAYDGWYDTAEGQAIFQQEARCLSYLSADYSGCWLEVGVGTGRFAMELGITHGIDPSPRMVTIAKRRGVRVYVGRVEQLPFRDRVFAGLLMVLTLCFVENPESAFLECARVLRDNGRLVIGTIPADCPWGRNYSKKGADRHPVYSHARFRTVAETIQLADKAGFRLQASCSTLLWEPGKPTDISRIEPGIVTGGGFVGLLFERHSS